MTAERIVSVIIPTHNRSAALRRTLEALSAQTYALQHVQVVVVADGCVDSTVEMARSYRAPFSLHVIEQAGQGPAAARNRGAEQASGRLLLFLDDDVEPTPHVIEAHVRAHERQAGRVCIGPYPPVVPGASLFRVGLRGWWQRTFQTLLQPGHRYAYTSVLTGNLSLHAELFARVGGFDHALRAHEDYEFGLRLIKLGVSLAVVPDALAYHHDESDFNMALLRKRAEGRADVVIGRRHPDLLHVLPFTRLARGRRSRTAALRIRALGWPRASDAVAAWLRRALDLLESVHLRRAWRHLRAFLHDYWYWRGVMEELGGRVGLVALLQQSDACGEQAHDTVQLDLREGLEQAERRLDAERPASADIRYGPHRIGVVPPRPGAEPLRGAHLRPILATDFALPLLKALALEGVITGSTATQRENLARSIEALTPWFGPMRAEHVWFEQYSQWHRLKSEHRVIPLPERGRVLGSASGLAPAEARSGRTRPDSGHL